MSVTVTPAHLRQLLDSPVEEPVLYVSVDEDDRTVDLDVWASAYVSHARIVVTRVQLVDWLGDDWSDDDVTEYLPELQEAVDRIALAD